MRKRRIIYNEDGDTVAGYRRNFYEAPMAVEDYLREMFDPLIGTQVDTYVWSIGTTLGLNFSPTGDQSGIELYRSPSGKFENLHNWRAWRNLKSYLEAGSNPPVLIAQAAHDIDMEVFFSLRMNDAHDAAHPERNIGRIKREHPDWLIGDPDATYEEQSIPWWMRKAFDYAVDDVRKHVIAIVEQILCFDSEGVELDFMSHPFVFRLGREQQDCHLLTDMMRELKALAATTGRLVMARVPATIERCERIGIEIRTWIREGLVDLLSLGRCVTPASIPTERWMKAVSGTACQVFPSVNTNHSAKLVLTESLRAFAMQHLRDGAHGVYLFNFFPQPNFRGYEQYFGADRFGWEALREIGDIETLEHRDKLYLFDWIRKETPRAYGYAIPEDLVDLPLELADESQREAIRFRIGDKLDGSVAPAITLRLEVANLSGLDELELFVNGWKLLGEERTHPYQYGADIAYPVSARALKTGANLLEISVKRRNPHIEPPLIVEKGEISIRYRSP